MVWDRLLSVFEKLGLFDLQLLTDLPPGLVLIFAEVCESEWLIHVDPGWVEGKLFCCQTPAPCFSDNFFSNSISSGVPARYAGGGIKYTLLKPSQAPRGGFSDSAVLGHVQTLLWCPLVPSSVWGLHAFAMEKWHKERERAKLTL